MNIKYIILFLGIVSCFSAYGQANGIRADTVVLKIKTELSAIDNILTDTPLLHISPFISPYVSKYKWPFSSHSEMPWDKIPIDMTITTPRIQFDMLLNSFNENSPLTYQNDFSNHRAFRFGHFPNSFLDYYYGSSRDTRIGLTTIHNKSAGLSYENEKISVTIGGSIMQYGHLRMPYHDIAISSSLEYFASDWLIFGVFGNYSVLPNQNATAGYISHDLTSPFSSYGGYAKIFFGGDFGVRVDIGRKFDPMKRKWVTTHRVSPIKKKK